MLALPPRGLAERREHGRLHPASEVGQDPAYAERSATKLYRTTPLRGLWQHAPYFHDGSAATLAAVVAHYNRVRKLNLSAEQQRDLVEFLKSLGKLGFASIVLYFTLSQDYRQLLAGMITNPVAFGLVIKSITVDILVAIVFVMGLIAAVDVVWSRFHWKQDLRMTKQEVKDEFKQSEGDPIIKSRLRSLARDRARKRMMTAVPRATLIIANPTHFSIALRYVREEDSAPVVLAKGQDLVALKIREIAKEHNIPIFEDVALARSMYKQVSVDSVIPSQFYQAVAELVRIVYSKKAERRQIS